MINKHSVLHSPKIRAAMRNYVVKFTRNINYHIIVVWFNSHRSKQAITPELVQRPRSVWTARFTCTLDIMRKKGRNQVPCMLCVAFLALALKHDARP